MKFHSGIIEKYTTEKNPADEEKIIVIDSENPGKLGERNKMFIETVKCTSESDPNYRWLNDEEEIDMETSTAGDVIIIDSRKSNSSNLQEMNTNASFLDIAEGETENESIYNPLDDEEMLNLCDERTKLLKEKLDQIPLYYMRNFKPDTGELETFLNTKELMLNKLNKISKPAFRTVIADSDALKTCLNEAKLLTNKSHNTSNPDLRIVITDDDEHYKHLSITAFPQSEIADKEIAEQSFGSIPIDDHEVMIINTKITPRAKKQNSFKNLFLNSAKDRTKKGSFNYLKKDQNQMNEYRQIQNRRKKNNFIADSHKKNGVGDTDIITVDSGDSWNINGSNKIKFLGKLHSSLRTVENKNKIKKYQIKSKQQEKSGKVVNENRGRNFKTKMLHFLSSAVGNNIQKHNKITTLSDYKKFIIINNAVTPRLDESNGPNKVFLESIKERAGKRLTFPFLMKNQHQMKKLKKNQRKKKKIKLKSDIMNSFGGMNLGNSENSIFKLNKSILHYQKAKKIFNLSNPSLGLEKIKFYTPISNISANGVEFMNSSNKNALKKFNQKVKNITSSTIHGKVKKPKDVVPGPKIINATGDVSSKKEAINSSHFKNQTLKKKQPLKLFRKNMVHGYIGLGNKTLPYGDDIIRHKEIFRSVMSTKPTVKHNTIPLLHGPFLKPRVVGKMNINVHKKPFNKITKNGVNLTTKHEMKEVNLKYWPKDDEVSYQMYYKPEILTDYYKDAPKEKFASSVNLNPGGQLLNIAYKVENLLNALSTLEKADMAYEAMGDSINNKNRKIIHHKNKNKKAMSRIIDQIHDDVMELDKELFYPNSEETREISIKSTSKSSFEPTINESYYQNRNPRQISVSGVQKRGGQSCVDRYIPVWANPFTYHESAHCLRFSDLWYSVYRLKDPFIYHSVYFEVFEKNCKSYEHGWKRCTGGDIVQIGTFHRKSVNDGPSIVFTYTPFSATNNKYFCFDPLLHQIMVPRMVPTNLVEKYPQVDEGPGRYLLVSPSGVSHDGEDCDKAGVGYSAFASQPDRCNKPAGSCLRNQPLDFWQHDNDALAHNQTGSFFLDNFAAVEDSSIKIAEGKQFLTVGYAGHYTSIVEIEMRIDDNIVIRNESPALIHEVLIDSTCEHQTKITIKVTNAGYVSTAYRPKITNCPVNVPNIWYDNEGPLVYIAPFRVHVFRVTLYGTTRPSRFHCSVEIMNNRSETLAVRRIRIQKYDRCFCVWHCLCSCAASSQKFGCHPMSIDHYHAAGFVGSVPETDVLLSKQITMTHYRENIARAVIVIAYLYAILIFFGLIKAIYGSLCYRRLALMHLQTLCPGFFQAAKLMPSLCPCRREILRTNSANSLSSDGSDIVNPQSKRPASVLLLEFFYNTICYVCIVGLYIFIIVAKSLKCCIFLCIPERRRDSRTLYDTRSFESSFSDMLEEHEKRGTLNSDEFLKKCEALKNKHMPYMLRKRNKRSKKDLLNDIREEFLDIYRNAAIHRNIKTKQNVFYGDGARSDIKFSSSKNHSYKKKTKSLNIKKSQLGIRNTLHKINDCITHNGENQRNKEQLRKKVKKFLVRKSIFSHIALHNIPKKILAKNEKKDIGSGSTSSDLADYATQESIKDNIMHRSIN